MRRMSRSLLVSFVLAASLAVPLVVTTLTAGPASATCTDTVDVSASFSPTSVSAGATNTPTNSVTLTNCTNTTQTVSFGGSVSQPSKCGSTVFNFGPISETLSANQVLTVNQVVAQAPSCTGTYTQTVNVTQGGTTLSTATASFTVT